MRVRALLAALVVATATMTLAPGAQAAKDLTIAPEAPEVSNCWPFGIGGPSEDWTPYFAFFYQNIPGFKLKRGDRLAFDLGARNENDPSSDIQMDIALAPTTTNGGTTESRPFKTVVKNAQTPKNPRGDTIVGNFELQFKAKSKFKFPAGGLIIRFSNPSTGYRADDTCDQVLVGTDSSDPSGFFLGRTDPPDEDGSGPWMVDDSDVGGFRILHAPKTKIPDGPKGKTDETDADFRFKSSDRGSKFKCSLDGGRFKPCKKREEFKNLEPGKHVLKVKAKDRDGLVDRSPAKRKWEILP